VTYHRYAALRLLLVLATTENNKEIRLPFLFPQFDYQNNI